MFTEAQIVGVLREAGAGAPLAEVIRTHGIARTTYFAWKAKYANATVPEPARLRELEQENARLKRVDAELALEDTAIKDVLHRTL